MTPTIPPMAVDEAMRIASIIERVEAATGPDRELDLAIHHIAQAKRYRWAEFGGAHPDQRLVAVEVEPEGLHETMYLSWIDKADVRTIPAYTASLDAAMTLVPEGSSEWNVEGWGSPSAVHDGRLSTAWVSGARRVYAATPALALCAAALKARSALQSEASDGQ